MKPAAFLTSLLALTGVAGAVSGYGHDGGDAEAVASKQIAHLQREYQKYIHATLKTRETGCTSKNILRRREWGSLSKAERRSYIEAVYCLHNNRTPLTPATAIPGVRNRYDDFVGSHLQHTAAVHTSGLFLPFHRFYVHLYEAALRAECGYRGAQPYWDWTLSYADGPTAPGAVLDGSPWSMGSNGAFVAGRPPLSVAGPALTRTFPPATGGGCVHSGPFTPDTFTVNLGPVSFEPAAPDGGLGYNPRCLVRDVSPAFAGDTRPTNVTALLGCADLACFNVQLDEPRGGVHGSGHFQVGGIALDVFASPADPVFWLHHAQVDRLWTIWQNLGDPRDRTYQVWGTQTAANIPPSENVTLDTAVPFGVLSPPKAVKELVSTIDGPLCYIYE